MKKHVPLQTNLIRQNCFILDVSPAVDLKSSSSEKFYESINEITVDHALKHDIVSVPYEITSDYVNSFADSADFRRDPVSAILNAPKRQGLGDIRDFQKVSEMDDTQAMQLFSQLKEKFAQSQPVPQPSPQPVPQTESNSQGE